MMVVCMLTSTADVTYMPWAFSPLIFVAPPGALAYGRVYFNNHISKIHALHPLLHTHTHTHTHPTLLRSNVALVRLLAYSASKDFQSCGKWSETRPLHTWPNLASDRPGHGGPQLSNAPPLCRWCSLGVLGLYIPGCRKPVPCAWKIPQGSKP